MIPTLEYSKFYHIYNCGINHQDIFKSPEDYRFFLKQLDKYIYPIADIYAWVMMKNHFHFLIRIKDQNDIGYYSKLESNNSNKQLKFQTSFIETEINRPYLINTHQLKCPNPTHHFSHLFNTYSKYFNKINLRSGALFERPFKRIELTTDEYILKLIVYIHANPVHHNFCESCGDYYWSSYGTILSNNNTKLKREQVLEWFENRENFIAVHQSKSDYYGNLKEFVLEDS